MPPLPSQGQTVMTQAQSALADVYAQALLDRTESNAEAEAVLGELESLVALLDEAEESFEHLLTESLMDVRERCEMVTRIFRGRVGDLTEAFLATLARRNRMDLLRPAARRLRRLLGKRQGQIEVLVTTAEPLAEDQRQALTDSLRKTLHAEPILSERVDPDVLGGVIVRVGDRVYDASVAGQLRKVSQNLAKRLAGRPGGEAELVWP